MHTAKLDWITPDAERVIAKHARVSTSDPEREEYARLLSYCIKHGHWSVLEQANASFEIITSRAISAQLIRHKSLCFQELSQRYCNPFEVISGVHDQPSQFSIRKQAEKNRQSSTEELDTGTVALFSEPMIELSLVHEVWWVCIAARYFSHTLVPHLLRACRCKGSKARNQSCKCGL